jgi:hypothetical protein
MSKEQRKTTQEKTQTGTPTGMNNNFILEKFPKLRTTNSQVLFPGKNNSFIKLGRDQDASRASGAGGKGFTQCGAIDIIAGLDSANGAHDEQRDPNFFNDASRIYLTQKGKINQYFGVAKGSSMGQEKWDAGIGMKSDNINIIGKKHIKLVTSRARINSKEKSGQGGLLDGSGKIDFIAGNFSGEETVKSLEIFGFKLPIKKKKVLQPLIKGDNQADLLDEMLKKITDIQGAVLDNRRAILEIALSYSSHIHPGVCAVGPVVTTPTPMALTILPTISNQFSKIPEDVIGSVNVGNLRENYLNPNFPEYIKSKNVSTT